MAAAALPLKGAESLAHFDLDEQKLHFAAHRDTVHIREHWGKEKTDSLRNSAMAEIEEGVDSCWKGVARMVDRNAAASDRIADVEVLEVELSEVAVAVDVAVAVAADGGDTAPAEEDVVDDTEAVADIDRPEAFPIVAAVVRSAEVAVLEAAAGAVDTSQRAVGQAKGRRIARMVTAAAVFFAEVAQRASEAIEGEGTHW